MNAKENENKVMAVNMGVRISIKLPKGLMMKKEIANKVIAITKP